MRKKQKVPGRAKPKYTEEQMRQAVLEVAYRRASLNQVSKRLKVCPKTLRRYVDCYLSASKEERNRFRFKPNYEMNQVFTNSLEKLFVMYLLNAHNKGRKLTNDYVRSAAYHFATRCQLHVPKSWNQNKFAGLDWLYSFQGRHPAIKKAIDECELEETMSNAETEFDLNRDSLSDENTIEWELAKTSTNDEVALAEFIEEIVLIGEEDVQSDDRTSTHDESGGNRALMREHDYIENVRIDAFPVSPESDGEDELIEHCEVSEEATEYSSSDVNIEIMCMKTEIDEFEENLREEIMCIKTEIDEFEENLTEAYQEIAFDNRVPADRVYNLDEIALVACNLNEVHPNAEVTACCCVNAAGDSLPPFLVFPRGPFRSEMLAGSPKHTCGMVSRRGLVNDEIFPHVLEHFADVIRASAKNKSVFIMDDDTHHVTVKSLDFCRKRGIALVTLPPQHSARLRPIERYAFRTLKSYFKQAYQKFRFSNSEAAITVYDVVALFFAIYPFAFTSEKIALGFRDTAVYPLNDVLLRNSRCPDTECGEETLPPGIELVQIVLDDDEVPETDRVRDEAVRGDSLTYSQFEPKKQPVEEFFEYLVGAYDELSRNGSLVPENVYNMDEIEMFVYNPAKSRSPDKVIGVLVCCYVNAAGSMIPPFVVYSGDEFDESMLSGCMEGVRGIASGSHPPEELSFLMLKHFQQYVRATPENRVLLIMDADRDHVTVRWMDFCWKHGIILVAVPPHASLTMQPLERTLFRRLFSDFKTRCSAFLREKRKRYVTKYDIGNILNTVFDMTFLSPPIVQSFKSLGLWPVNKDLFPAAEVCLDGPPSSVPWAHAYLQENCDAEQKIVTNDDDWRSE